MFQEFYSALREIATNVQAAEDQDRQGFKVGAKLNRQEAIRQLEDLRGQLLAQEWFS